MESGIQSWLGLPTLGLAIALVVTVIGARLTTGSANLMLAIAWILATISIFSLPAVAQLNLVPRLLSTLLLASIVGFGLYFLRWEEPTVTVSMQETPNSQEAKRPLHDGSAEPKLRAVIENMNVHEFSQFPGVASTVLVVSVTNDGALSIADHWTLKVTLPDGQIKTGVQLTIPPRLTFRGASGASVYSQKDALYDKAVKNPIQRGQKMTGVLWFLLAGVESKDVTPNKVSLTFKDFLDKDYTAEVKAVHHGAPPIYFPGLEQQIREGLFVK